MSDFAQTFNGRPAPQDTTMSVSMAMAVLFDPQGFFPETFKAQARKVIESQGTPEQKSFLPKETQFRESQKQRLSGIEQVSGNQLLSRA